MLGWPFSPTSRLPADTKRPWKRPRTGLRLRPNLHQEQQPVARQDHHGGRGRSGSAPRWPHRRRPSAGPRFLPHQPGQPARPTCGENRSTPWCRNSCGPKRWASPTSSPIPAPTPAAAKRPACARIIEALDEIDRQTRGLSVGCLLETTAGAGTTLGWRFEQLAAILAGVRSPERLGVCFDTCHVFAAGYPLATAAAIAATMREFDRLVGVGQIRAFHLNDSLREQGSRADRHAHIGQGRIGLEGFGPCSADRRFRDRPMYLETPKGRKGKRIGTRSIWACCAALAGGDENAEESRRVGKTLSAASANRRCHPSLPYPLDPGAVIDLAGRADRLRIAPFPPHRPTQDCGRDGMPPRRQTRAMDLTYFKRYRMEIDLAGVDSRRRCRPGIGSWPGIRRCWTPLPRRSI